MTWPPQTEHDVTVALTLGEVAESNRLDMKMAVGNDDRARKETAKDLASFAVDGGALLIGVRENKEQRVFSPEPVDLRDVIEKIEQIASNRIDPPLLVRPREIPSAIEGMGFVWVEIPASPDAPHMMDGRYYGRGERTNRILKDSDVLRHHSRRKDTLQIVHERLNELQERDPFPSSRPSQSPTAEPTAQFGHLYLTASPRTGSPNLAESLVWERKDDIRRFVYEANRQAPGFLGNWSIIGSGGVQVPRPSALSITNLTNETAKLQSDEEYGYDVRVGTDGSIGFISTGATSGGGGRGELLLRDGTVFACTWQHLAVIRSVSEAIGYTGTWDLGLRVTDLAGRRSYMTQDRSVATRGAPAYEDSKYERIVSATNLDLESPNRLVKLLTRPLFQSLGSWDYWTRQVIELA